ncbi:WXG100 family type VII secretion target [Streptomyces sp. TRM49041]|uniref:WXG100 family type VII secretion target n=1 Tax=Streptomyces sp. TRM49041 TaxID=2603216 RepID=UPI0011EFE8B7|nr:WXG100 family type VII secretion target [Streptomyces sp. TRM49041]
MSEDLGTKVRYSSVTLMAERLRFLAKDTAEDLTRMEQAIKVVTDTWDGEAHREYLALQKKYRARADHMKTQLDQIARIIAEGKDKYQTTDRKASQLFTEGY